MTVAWRCVCLGNEKLASHIQTTRVLNGYLLGFPFILRLAHFVLIIRGSVETGYLFFFLLLVALWFSPPSSTVLSLCGFYCPPHFLAFGIGGCENTIYLLNVRPTRRVEIDSVVSETPKT